jgi:hypothetical protein
MEQNFSGLRYMHELQIKQYEGGLGAILSSKTSYSLHNRKMNGAMTASGDATQKQCNYLLRGGRSE